MGLMDRFRKPAAVPKQKPELLKDESEEQLDQLIGELKEENQRTKDGPVEFRQAPPKVREWTAMIETKDEEDENGMVRLHHIKLQENFAGSVMNGDKSFELRRNDRGYQKGDHIEFEVVNTVGAPVIGHPLNEKRFKITYVISGWGLQEGFVALAIREVEKNEDPQ